MGSAVGFLALSCTVILLAAPAQAESDHDKAWKAYQAGEIVGLDAIIEYVAEAFECRVLEVGLDAPAGDEKAPWVYAVTVMTDKGHVLMLEVDATSMRILSVQGADQPHPPPPE